jgi:ISXO2-like transposase domain
VKVPVPGLQSLRASQRASASSRGGVLRGLGGARAEDAAHLADDTEIPLRQLRHFTRSTEVRPCALQANGKKLQSPVYARRLRLCLVPNRSTKTLTGFVQENVVKGAVVRTDGWGGYDELTKLGYAHEPMVQGGDGAKIDTHLPMIHIPFSNLKTWLMGTHHGVSQQHLSAYLNEFVFRLNRRFYPMTAFASIKAKLLWVAYRCANRIGKV